MKQEKYLFIFIIVLATVLRLAFLSSSPAGLNADEAALGYNAYSLLETGQDEHGTTWPLVFRSFDDYKPPFYVYLSLPFIKLLGLNTLAIRLPSAILGILTVILTYYFTNLLFPNLKLRTKNYELTAGGIAAFLLAISPWHLHFSRGAWEVNSATFFLFLGIYAFVRAQKNPKFYILSAVSIIVSLYTYHSIRLIAPLLLLSFSFIYRRSLISQLRTKEYRNFIIASFVLGTVLVSPLVKQMLSPEGQSRFSGVSIFADSGPLWEALEARRLSDNPDAFTTRLLHNKYLTYSKRFASNYLSHYSLDFLFVGGDEIARSKVPDSGQSYPLLIPFYILGFLALLVLNSRQSKLILAWLLIAPLAAALTFQSPHALRSQNMAIPLNILFALGITYAFTWINKVKPKSTLIIFTVLILFMLQSHFSYLKQYYIEYPKQLPHAWQYGFDQLTEYLEPRLDDYDKIIISDRYDQPYILLAFYLQYPPHQLQQELVFSNRDNFGFSTGRSFANLEFHSIGWKVDSQNESSLVVVADETVPGGLEPLHTIYYPNNQPVFRIYETP